MNSTIHYHHRHQATLSNRECLICGSKAIGINFGVPTCAPCKGMKLFDLPCHHSDTKLLKEKNITMIDKTIRYFQIRRCSSCRLHRCFEVAMKEDLIRTDEENRQHKQLVDSNRIQRTLIKQRQQKKQSSIVQHIVNNNDLVSRIDWRHLSNIVYAYDTCCVKLYLEQRVNMFTHGISQKELLMKNYGLLPIGLTISLTSFLRSLPVFQSLSRSNQSFLCKNNIRPLIFINFHELNQSCFSEPCQIVAYKSIMEFICGPELYKQFAHIENLAEKLMIADPIITRLWIIVLFFSTPLFSYYDSKSKKIKVKKKLPFIDIQNTYATLLWIYLLYRHGPLESVRIYSNVIRIFLNMLRVGIDIHMRLRMEKYLISIDTTLDELVQLDINTDQ
ncbi:unnamed protein product [Rotaria sp. Silwood2]|nr:unnamed protein product [Rotaria sp. Silwood2]CAF2902782.1 unnamed protein product [Rotaria sp. Silwood2]CAF3877551.1 unnamed protein product [Rotaria sp. Silwood2]CAF4403264.1 unnamed protein product [Rotaria sp. Silwood2]